VLSSEGSFIAQLEKKDLERLRKITRHAYFKKNRQIPTVEQCDQYIEELGPDAAVDALNDQTR